MKRKLIIFSLCLGVLGACRKDLQNAGNQEKSNVTSVMKGDTTIHKFVINGNPTYVNKINGEYYFSEDIRITVEQFNYLKNRAEGGNSTIERSSIIKSFASTWPNGIVYYQKITGFSSAEIGTIKEAMSMISSSTSIRFNERTNQTEYIRFERSNLENSSPFGWIRNRVNDIRLKNIQVGVIAHEIMHSLGVQHEHSRSDRNNHVRVNMQAIIPGFEYNFNTSPDFADFGQFDFSSIMLYSSTDFARFSHAPTITRIDGSTFRAQRSSLSAGDIAGLNHLYQPVKTTGLRNGVYRIQTKSDEGLSIESSNDSLVNGSRVILNRNQNVNKQKFIFRKSDRHGYFIIKSMIDTSVVLTATGSQNGSAVELRTLNNNNTQLWKLYNLGNDGFSFEPLNAPQMRLDIQNGAAMENNFIVISNENNRISQRFRTEVLQ